MAFVPSVSVSQYYVYRHLRKDSGIPFYIGIGKEIEGVFQYKRAYSKNHRNKHWHHIVSKYGYCVEILYETTCADEIESKEREFILLYGRVDLKTGTLVNMTDGGGVNFSFGPEVRKKMSERMMGHKMNVGRKHSEESKKKMSIVQSARDYSYQIGRKMPPHVGKACSERSKGNKYCLGKTHSEESKAKMSLAKKGKMSDEERKIRSDRMKGVKNFLGKTHSEEFKQKLSNRFKGIPLKDSQVNNMRKTHTERYGKPVLQYDLDGVFIKEYPSKRDCCLSVGISRTSLKGYLNGLPNKSKYIYKYKEDVGFRQVQMKRRVFEMKSLTA